MSTIRASASTRIEQNPQGRLVSFTKSGTWQHPWFTIARWQPAAKAFAAFVKPGFVNGIAPVVRTTVDALKDAQGTFYGQLVDARTGAAEIAQLAKLAIGNGENGGLPGDTVIDVPLYQTPPIPLNFRNLGWDGSGDVPQFFLNKGVAKAPAPIDPLAVLAGKASPAPPASPSNLRLLRAADVILHNPRNALASQIELAPGPATGISNVTQTLTLRSQAPGDRLKVFSSAKFNPPRAFGGSADLLAGDYTEPNFDELLISTVYLLSPINTPPLSAPDSTWQVFVRHSLFWNLHATQPQLEVIGADTAIQSLLAITNLLGGGAGSLAINFLSASIDDAYAAASNILASHSMAKNYWTPTGGGTTSAFPAETATAATPGLSKKTNAEIAADYAAKLEKSQSLDPVFPFEGIAFNTSLLAA